MLRNLRQRQDTPGLGGTGVKIDKDVYGRNILKVVIFLWTQQHSGDAERKFQQDSAPAHTAKMTQHWYEVLCLGFIIFAEWPSYSPDLYSMDYRVWSILEARTCAKPQQSLESLKQSLLWKWNTITLEELWPISENFKKLLRLFIAARGSHFETA